MTREEINFTDMNEVTVKPVTDTVYVLRYDLWLNQRKRKVFNVIFEKEGVSCRVFCVYRLVGSEELDLITNISHLVPNTSCEVKVRGVLEDNSKSSYKGEVYISRDGRGTKSFLENSALTTGEATHTTVEPILRIEQNDVSASHSSSTGRIDEREIYYLGTRGLSRSSAIKLISESFLGSYSEYLKKV